MVDILALAINKDKSKVLKEVYDDQRSEDEDVKDYIERVINKVDKLTTAIWLSVLIIKWLKIKKRVNQTKIEPVYITY